MSQNLITLMTTAAELRTGGMSWENVAREVNRKAGTCSKWPSRYRREWNRIYMDAQRQRYEEVSNESLSYLRTLLRSKEDKTKLKSIEMVLRYGPAAIAGLTG